MARWRASVVVAVAVAACGVGLAEEIDYHDSFDAALAAAKENQQLVMVVVVAPNHESSAKMKSDVLASEPVAKLIRQYFAPVVVDLGELRAGRQKLPEPLKARYLKGDQLHMPMPCAVFYDRDGKQVTKLAQFVIDQKGTTRWFDELPGSLRPESFHTVLKTLSDKVAKARPARERRDMTRYMRRGQEALEHQDYRTAIAALQAVVAEGLPGEERDLATRLLAEIDQKALVKLEDGKALEAERKLGSAVRAYRDCVRDFHGGKAARKAAARLKALRDDPAVRKRLHDYMAAQLVAKAERAMKRGQYGVAAADLDRVLERYADAEGAAKAKQLRQKLDSDPEIKAELREASVRADAERLLRLGDGYRRNKMLDKALATFRQVAEKFPDTRYAATAEEKIAELRAELDQ